jgi:hypothetical protein
MESNLAELEKVSQNNRAKMIEVIDVIEQKWLRLFGEANKSAFAALKPSIRPKPFSTLDEETDSGFNCPTQDSWETPPGLKLRPDLFVPVETGCTSGNRNVVPQLPRSPLHIPLDGFSKTQDVSLACQMAKHDHVAGSDRRNLF